MTLTPASEQDLEIDSNEVSTQYLHFHFFRHSMCFFLGVGIVATKWIFYWTSEVTCCQVIEAQFPKNYNHASK